MATQNSPPLEEWEHIIPGVDGEVIRLEDTPGLVFMILRCSSENDKLVPQGKFVYEIHNEKGNYLGRLSVGGSGLPRTIEEAKSLIGSTYQRLLKKG